MRPRDIDSAKAAGRALVRRAEVAVRRRPSTTVPALRVAAEPSAAPSVWVITPDWNRASGGVRKLYRAVDVLNAAGVPAAVVHQRPGFSCTWFEHETRIVPAPRVTVGPRDVIVVPEIYWPSIRRLPSGIRQVIYNQNAYLTLEALAEGGRAAAAPYVDNPDLAAIAVVSDENAELLRYAFPGVPVQRIRHGLDPALLHPPAQPPGRRIAYMPRRRADEARQVIELLRLRGVLEGWEVISIERRSEAEVAELLRGSRIFLSFSEREGFGLPPCEALACGCLVVGFDGFAGREFFRPPFATAVANGDVAAFARAAEALVHWTEEDPAAAHAVAADGARFVREHYSPEAERHDLVEVFAPR